MKQQELGLKPGNVFPILQRLVFLLFSPLQAVSFYPVCVKVRRVVISFMGTNVVLGLVCGARLLLCTIRVSLLCLLSSMTRFSTTVCPANGWMSFGWWTILDTHGKMLRVKNPAALQFLTQKQRAWHLLPYPALTYFVLPIHPLNGHMHNPYLKACLLPFIYTLIEEDFMERAGVLNVLYTQCIVHNMEE
jgi:hypothetical protein